ncbi:beige/beach-related [Anaeramoeba flamelloides]|uniref:Beige/beach-related n=1 Tax=Anaeramoeba flamelloides TaxID=1746091 RepID=A0ABQ8Y7R1_9EUKA|nr:beige/beach-related [Anaeramoeba flamelloides]
MNSIKQLELKNLIKKIQKDQRILRYLERKEEIVFKFNCSRITELDSTVAICLISQKNIYLIDNYRINTEGEIEEFFKKEENIWSSTSKQKQTDENDKKNKKIKKHKCIKIPILELSDLKKRRYLLQKTALEFFSHEGINHLINLDNSKTVKTVIKKVSSLYISPVEGMEEIGIFGTVENFLKPVNKSKLWEDGLISNFEYLMYINSLAGRTFNDLTQYPVFPWILSDYDSKDLDLSDPNVYRDLSKPMGALGNDRAEQFKMRYENWEDPSGQIPAFHYGSHYSSSGIVLYYLLRLEPFTKLFIKFQGGAFDHADRLFQSIAKTYKAASGENMSDVKELIPEFFYMPEFLKNQNKYYFGKKASNREIVDDVELPPWANNDPYEFIRINRMALESDYVSEHLHEWIDLIFGYKQRGEEAAKALNVFYYLTYVGAVNLDKIEDEVEKTSIIAQINNFGQTPIQLFKKPHPKKKINTKKKKLVISSNPNSLESEIVHEYTEAIGNIDINTNNQVYCLGEKKLLIPNTFKYISWNNSDHSLRFKTLEGDYDLKVYENMHLGKINSVAVADCGKLVVTGGTDSVINFWRNKYIRNKQTLVLINTFIGHKSEITSLAISKELMIIVSGSKDNSCIIWDIGNLIFLRKLENFSNTICDIQINHSTGEIIACSNSELKIWTINGNLLAKLQNVKIPITCIKMTNMGEHNNDHVYITGHIDGSISFWALIHKNGIRSFKQIFVKKVSNVKISALYVSFNNQILYTGDQNGNLLSWKIPNNEQNLKKNYDLL